MVSYSILFPRMIAVAGLAELWLLRWISYSYLAKRWGWSKSKVGRFMLKVGEYGIICRISFSSSHGSVISMCRYREMILGDDCEEIQLRRIGEILSLSRSLEMVWTNSKMRTFCPLHWNASSILILPPSFQRKKSGIVLASQKKTSMLAQSRPQGLSYYKGRSVSGKEVLPEGTTG